MTEDEAAAGMAPLAALLCNVAAHPTGAEAAVVLAAPGDASAAAEWVAADGTAHADFVVALGRRTAVRTVQLVCGPMGMAAAAIPEVQVAVADSAAGADAAALVPAALDPTDVRDFGALEPLNYVLPDPEPGRVLRVRLVARGGGIRIARLRFVGAEAALEAAPPRDDAEADAELAVPRPPPLPPLLPPVHTVESGGAVSVLLRTEVGITGLAFQVQPVEPGRRACGGTWVRYHFVDSEGHRLEQGRLAVPLVAAQCTLMYRLPKRTLAAGATFECEPGASGAAEAARLLPALF